MSTELKTYYAGDLRGDAVVVLRSEAEAEIARLRALLADWLTSFVDHIEGGEADQLVKSTHAALTSGEQR